MPDDPHDPDSHRTVPDPPSLDATAPQSNSRSRSTTEMVPGWLSSWTRYRVVAYAGGGGMGQVFEAFDPRLSRRVAVKFISGDDPRLVERFQEEAKSQARVDHERICKIYEVSEFSGRPYISMQFIDGDELDVAATKMTIEERLIVMQQVADGIHEAHRAGLVHRDIKPSNILVERAPSGEWRPFVMDFGLARRSESANLTMPGAVVGTPNYMSPEQARGDSANVSRQRDVYSLGATLYAIAAGRPPFTGNTLAELVPKILNDVPANLRRRDRTIPAEVDAVAQRALRKDPAHRYRSARAFSEDIGRYLDGQPILAKPTTWWYRTQLRAARNRSVVGLGVLAACALLVAIGWGVKEQQHAAGRARLAETFGREVERVDALARYTAMAPAHDIRPSRGQIRARMDGIRSSMDASGAIAEPSGRYALGRGHLVLGEIDDALTELRAAEALGNDGPDLHYALGLALGAMYQRDMLKVETTASSAERQRIAARADSLYRQPAETALAAAASGATLDTPNYVLALLHFHAGEFPQALDRARLVAEEQVHFFEALRLQGDVHRELMSAAADSGDAEIADQEYQRALDAYESATSIAPSDLQTYLAVAALARLRAADAVDADGIAVADAAKVGFDALDTVTLLDPDHVDAGVHRVTLLSAVAKQRLAQQSGSPDSLLDLAAALGRTVTDANPNHEDAQVALALVYQLRADRSRRSGADPTDDFNAAIDSYEKAASLAPMTSRYYTKIGLLYKLMSVSLGERGIDATEAIQRSIDAYTQGLAIDPASYELNANLAIAHYRRAAESDSDRRGALESLAAADTYFLRATSLNPNSLAIHYNWGRALALRADLEYEVGTDAESTTNDAVRAFRSAIAASPQSPYTALVWDAAASAFLVRAEHDALDEAEAAAAFDSATALYTRSLSVNPDYHFALSNLGGLYARRPARSSSDTLAQSAQALELLRRAIEIRPQYASNYVHVASAYVARAISSVGDIGSHLAAARESLDVALRCNPELFAAYMWYGQVELLSARGADHNAVRVSLGKAIKQFREALRIIPDSRDAISAIADAHVRRVENDSFTGEQLTHAIDAVNQLSSMVGTTETVADLQRRLERVAER